MSAGDDDDNATTSGSLPLQLFPFDRVIVTFPDAAAARWADGGPLRLLRRLYSSSSSSETEFTAAHDPLGARVGSGGGTVAALVDHHRARAPTMAKQSNNSKILILHAGGAASRSPTQMCLGKAWTSLPCCCSRSKSTADQELLQTPLQLWLEVCQRIFGSGVPEGTVVVVASDTLLDLPTRMTDDDDDDDDGCIVDWQAALQNRNAVVALAVPAPLTTAQNHGVFVLSKQHQQQQQSSVSESPITSILPCQRVLQKPSLEALADCSFSLRTPTNDSNDEQQPQQQCCAWIDTGVTIFSPAAAQALCRLGAAADAALQRCTATGLRRLYDNEKDKNGSLPLTIEEFAQEQSLSVDLYTHILRALRLADDDELDRTTTTTAAAASRRERYLQQHEHDGLDSNILRAIWEALAPTALQVWAVPQGRFWHLGTTRELQQFLVCGTSSGIDVEEDDCATTEPTHPRATPLFGESKRKSCREFGRRLGLTRRRLACTLLDNAHPTAVILHSLVQVLDEQQNEHESSSSIGADTILEHCHLRAQERIRIGRGCLVSGLRCSSSLNIEDAIDIPDDLMVHMLPLSAASNDDDGESLYVVLTLGMDDSIKKRDTLYGLPFQDYQKRTGLIDSDLWDDKTTSRNLWTAKIHPVISLQRSGVSFSSVFSWLQTLLQSKHSSPVDEASFQNWKEGPRLSLSEIRDRADAPTEFAYRESLRAAIHEQKRQFFESLASAVRKDGCSVPLRHLPFVIDEYAATVTAAETTYSPSSAMTCDVCAVLQSFDAAVLESLQADHPQFGVAARVFWIISGFLNEISEVTPPASSVTTLTSDDEFITQLRASLLKFQTELSSESSTARALKSLFRIRDKLIGSGQCSKKSFQVLSKLMEGLAGMVTAQHVVEAKGMSQKLGSQRPVHDCWILASAPARVDLSGGWTDTPPICFDGSAVTGMAVLLDQRRPLACRARIVSGSTGVLLRAESRGIKDGALVSWVECELSSVTDLVKDHQNPSADCSLLKCILIHLGFVATKAGDEHSDFQLLLNRFCRSSRDTSNVRLEIFATSLLPHGSGLGSSSILAGVILAAVGKCIGAGDNSRSKYNSDLIDSVLCVEQLLTTGGGFQDQVNGLIGGIKTVRSIANDFPMRLSIEQLQVDPVFQQRLNSSIVLVYTGQTRLAKNLLQNVLRRWSKRTPEIVETILSLVQGAEDCREAVELGDLGALGTCISEYWVCKKFMARGSSSSSSSATAGPDVEPLVVRFTIETLQKRGLLRGASLCGAGGGGFLVLLTSDAVSSPSDLASALHEEASQQQNNDYFSDVIDTFSWHQCTLSDEGLAVRQLDASIKGDSTFDISWLVVGDDDY